jgi:hypothetical protein
MPLLPPLQNDEAAVAARTTLEGLAIRLGNVPNMYRTFAHAPKVLDAAVTMAKAIRSDLAPSSRDVAYANITTTRWRELQD